MKTRINPYLGFKDNARQAMEFYHSVFGGELVIRTFKEFNASQDPSEDDKVMHSMLDAGDTVTFMAADTPDNMEYYPSSNISMSLSGYNEAEIRGYWDKLAEGAKIREPLSLAPWGDTFGMLTDKFGVEWLVNIAGKEVAE